MKVTPLAAYAALIVFGLFALAGVLLVQPGPESSARLALLFGVIGTVVAALVAVLRSDQAATSSAQAASQTNGSLDARIEEGVHRALNARAASAPADRSTDPPAAGA